MNHVISTAQIEEAARRIYAYRENCLSVLDSQTHSLRWSTVPDNLKESYRTMARVAAPHLQGQIAAASAEEIDQIISAVEREKNIVLLPGVGEAVIRKFIQIRQDERRAKIRAVLSRYRAQIDNGRTSVEAMVDEIMTSIDAGE